MMAVSRRVGGLGCAFFGCLLFGLACAGRAGEGQAKGALIVSERGYWRRYYRFGADQVSPATLAAQGDAILGRGLLQRLKRTTEGSLRSSGNDGYAVFRASAFALSEARRTGTLEALTRAKSAPARAEWTRHVFLRMFFDPYTAPPPPDGWMAAEFDDSSWVLARSPFQVDLPNDLPPERTTGNMAKVHIESLQYIGGGRQSSYYRTRFLVDEPGDATLRLVYRGGVRVFLNGKELARGHLPEGELAPDVPGGDYPLKAYSNAALRDRVLGPVAIPASRLRKGANVLALEVRASLLHPTVLKRKRSKSWNALHDREGMWRHIHLAKLELRAVSAKAPSALRRPAGVQVWVQDSHHRVASTEFRAPGEGAGTVRFVGPRNATCSAQVVVGTDRDLAGLEARPGKLTRAGGTEGLGASALRVLHMAPYPADGFNEKLGDERGLGGSFPDATALARYERMAVPAAPYIFDHITAAPPGPIPAGTCRPLWLSLRIPADAAPGTYRGAVHIAAQGIRPVSVPVEAEVIDWRLPDPRDFQTFVACEQNPYGVARHYGVEPWSDGHLKLLEASFRQLGRVGNTWLNVPVLRRTEFGNHDDSPIRWTRRKDGTLAFDYTRLDRYLDLAVTHWGTPRVIHFAVMHGQKGGLKPPPSTDVTILDERTGKTTLLPVGAPGVAGPQKRAIWHAFATALYKHMKARGLEKSMHWGYPLDKEEDPELRVILGECTPEVGWVAGPHQIGRWGFKDPTAYRVFGTVRYFNNWPTFRMDLGWKSTVTHLAIPRVDSSVLSLHTASHPFAYRVFADRALALGRGGICRIGADEWASAHYSGMRIPTWIVGMPVLFVLWPGREGAESSARFEALIEGVQEAEARIFIEQAIDRGRLPGPVARRLTQLLREHFLETGIFQSKLCIFEIEKYHHRWQARSRALYRAAAEAAAALRSAGR